MGLLKAKANTNKLKPLLTLLLLVTAAMGGVFTYQHLQHAVTTLAIRARTVWGCAILARC